MGAFGDALLDFSSGAMDVLGRLFGIYTHDETFTDIQIFNLLTPDVADESAKRYSVRNSGGNAKLFHTAYRSFQRQYKRRYSSSFLESLGYAPSNSSVTRTISDPLLITYLQDTFSYTTVDLIVGRDVYLTLNQKANYGRQFVTGYDHLTTSVIYLGESYLYSQVIEVSPTEITLKFVRNFNDSIIDNLTDNYSYDDINETVIIEGEVYDVGVISSIINGSDEYETICTHQGATLPDETILTSVERFDENYSDILFDEECTYSEYRVISGEIDTATRYFIAEANTLPIYIYQNIDITAIIPMKENNVLANDSGELSRILKKLNLSYDQLVENLDNPDLDAAYLMTGLDTAVDNYSHNMVMFKMFDLMSPGSGNTTISISELNMSYSFTLSKSTISGVITDVGNYVRLGISSDGITLRYQGNSSEYQEIVVSNYEHRYIISGQSATAYFTDQTTRLIIPLDIFNSLRYRDWVNVYERSLCVLGYAVEVVEVQWYETAGFSFILKVFAVVWTVWTWGSDGGSALALVQSIVVNFAIAKIVMMLASAIGGPLGMLIAAVVAVYLAYQYGGLDELEGAELWLKSAITGLNTISQAYSIEAQEVATRLEEDISKLEDKINDINEKLKEYEDNGAYYASSTLPFKSLGSPDSLFQTIEQYVGGIVNTEWLVDGNWLYDIDSQINLRNQVYVG